MRKYQKAKGFVFGFVTCALLSNSFVIGHSESISKQLTAVYNGIKLVVNGQTVVPKDSNGNEVEPFVVNGTTYLPVRAISQALGQSVSWEGTTSTVYIGANKQIAQPTIWLKDMKTMAGNLHNGTTEIYDNLGKSYNNYVKMSNSSLTYALNGQYSKFTGTLILSEGGKNSYTSKRLKVFLDDKLVYTSSNLTSGSFPIDYDIDVKGALKMQLVWEWDYDNSSYGKGHTPGKYYPVSSDSDVGIVNPGLWE